MRSPAQAGVIAVLVIVVAAAVAALVVTAIRYARGGGIRPARRVKCHTRADCSGHGACTAGKCVCDAGYSGTHCKTKAAACRTAADCSNNGKCTAGKCVCNDGFSGAKCSELTCNKRRCANGTECDCTTGKCICSAGYHTDPHTGYCVGGHPASGCAHNSDCSGQATKKKCLVSGGHGTCVECLVPGDCPHSKPLCSSNVCTASTPGANSDATAEFVVNAYDPTTGAAVTTTNEWLNAEIGKCKRGDIMFLWTDYMAFDDDSIAALSAAIGRGATLCFGDDRLQICSNHGSTQTYTCATVPTGVDCSGEYANGNCYLGGKDGGDKRVQKPQWLRADAGPVGVGCLHVSERHQVPRGCRAGDGRGALLA